MALIDETDMVCSFADGELACSQKFLRSSYPGLDDILVRRLAGKRWLRIVAETKIDSKIYLLPFRKGLYRIPRFFRILHLSLSLASQPSQAAPFPAQA
jgi:hypothetical protein